MDHYKSKAFLEKCLKELENMSQEEFNRIEKEKEIETDFDYTKMILKTLEFKEWANLNNIEIYNQDSYNLFITYNLKSLLISEEDDYDFYVRFHISGIYLNEYMWYKDVLYSRKKESDDFWVAVDTIIKNKKMVLNFICNCGNTTFNIFAYKKIYLCRCSQCNKERVLGD